MDVSFILTNQSKQLIPMIIYFCGDTSTQVSRSKLKKDIVHVQILHFYIFLKTKQNFVWSYFSWNFSLLVINNQLYFVSFLFFLFWFVFFHFLLVILIEINTFTHILIVFILFFRLLLYSFLFIYIIWTHFKLK